MRRADEAALEETELQVAASQKQREEIHREIIKCEKLRVRSCVKSAINVLYQ